ncbi:hypothetical protein [Demequina sp.]|uniref:DUF7507 domain-containing protein n=1 Tax=Demequina sp. TaxID=2050685 RepID=UPI0025BDFF66|nr:hypothetical protein [Demequina sp.]
MSRALALPSAVLRAFAAVIVALLAAIGLSVATAPTASADPGVWDVSDAHVGFSWRVPDSWNDVNANGSLDAGDTLRYVFDITAFTETVHVTTIGFAGFSWGVNADASPGSPLYRAMIVTVTEAQLNDVGWGPYMPPNTFHYTVGESAGSLTFGSPALYATPSPITVSTAFALTETHGSVPDQAVEGDSAKYVTTVTNTSAVNISFTPSSGLDADTFPHALAPGASTILYTPHVGVTYAHMVAGGVAFADASITWASSDAAGTIPVPLATVPTEPIDASFSAGVATEVNDGATGDPVPLGDAEAGDVVDYTFQLTNTGNVWLQGMRLISGTFPGEFAPHTLSSGAIGLAPGQSVPNSVALSTHLTSEGSGVLHPYTLTAADVFRGYVDLDFSVVAGPTLAIADADRPAYTQSFAPRVFLRNFTTSATLTATATLNDPNGDSRAQAGETITYDWRIVNTSDQAITVTRLYKRPAIGVDSGVGAGAPDGAVIARDGELTGSFTYTVTADDEDSWLIQFDVLADIEGSADGGTATVSRSTSGVLAQPYEAPSPRHLEVAGYYDDANGDGKANVGETVTVEVAVQNFGSYPLTGVVVTDGAGANATGLLPAFPTSIGSYEFPTRSFDHVLTADDLTRGTFFYTALLDADGMSTQSADSTYSLAVQAYVAPAHTVTTTAIYDDLNADGFPSIGETVTVTATVANVGGYPLTGLVVDDAPGSDVTGLLPAFPGTVPAGTNATETFDHVLTPADFARGTFTYSARLTADGVSLPEFSAPVVLTDISFAAYATDLEGTAAGGIVVCDADGNVVSNLTIGQDYKVAPVMCGYAGPADGYRTMAFSTPMQLGVDTFAVTIPGALGVGEHRIALYGPGGELVGWRGVAVAEPIAYAGLASTGWDSGMGLAGLAAALILMGAAGMTEGARRRR